MGSVTPLSDKDRIFTNVYGFQSPDLKAARDRGDWDDTAKLMQLGQDASSTWSRNPACAAAAGRVSRRA